MSERTFVVGDKVITIGLDDYRALKAIESAFTQNVIANHVFQLAARRTAWQMQDSKGLKGNSVEQAKALVAFCDAAVAPLNRTFGEQALLAALPDAAKEERIVDVCRALGANKLAALCEKARNTPKP